jgi:hypothetical protein
MPNIMFEGLIAYSLLIYKFYLNDRRAEQHPGNCVTFFDEEGW